MRRGWWNPLRIRPGEPTMKICHLSTFWPNRFGHTHYTDNLIRGMRAHQAERHLVLAEDGSERRETDGYTCVPCFSRHLDYVDGIVSEARKTRPDVMLIQYSNDLFGDDNRFPRLLAALRREGIRTVVNTHSVYREAARTGFRPGRDSASFDRAMGAEATRIQVHAPRMRDELTGRGVALAKIVVIPHGSRAMEQRDPEKSRLLLGLPGDAKVVLFFGFLWIGKGIAFLLDVFRGVLKAVPEAFLLVAGHTRRTRWASYVTYLKARAAVLGISRRTRFWGAYVEEDMVPTVYSAADLVAMPYRQDYSSVSGVVHQTAGIGKLMLCSRGPKFDEVEAFAPELVLAHDDRRGWTSAAVRALSDPAWGEAARQKIVRFGEDTRWDRVGRTYVDLCAQLLTEAVRC
jgi:glycosyltransferase involved in cell wall biosynthesis